MKPMISKCIESIFFLLGIGHVLLFLSFLSPVLPQDIGNVVTVNTNLRILKKESSDNIVHSSNRKKSSSQDLVSSLDSSLENILLDEDESDSNVYKSAGIEAGDSSSGGEVSVIVQRVCRFVNTLGSSENRIIKAQIQKLVESQNLENEIQTDYTVGVYYYPWHARNFHGRQYLREKLDPPQLPALGEYSDRDCETIGQHLVWSRRSSINLWVTSWWGKDKDSDITTRDHILKNPFLGDMKIAIHYETKARTKFNSTSEPFGYLGHIESDFEYLAETYFSHPNYQTITTTEKIKNLDGKMVKKETTKPVVVIYLARSLESRGILGNVTEIMRSTTKRYGFDDVYIVGDFNFGPCRSCSSGMAYLDAITNYDIYGSIQVIHQESQSLSDIKVGYAGRDAVEEYFSQQKVWRNRAFDKNVAYIPSVTPGYNDMGVRPQVGHVPLSRKIDQNSQYGSLFRVLLRGAKKDVDKDTGNMILINSFNEWHEDTQIEPVVSSGTTTNEFLDSPEQYNFTEGVYYEPYGETYLDILKFNMIGR